MQLNATTALVTALISAVIGFGLAFYIERKINSRMQKKSQKILTTMAMMSLGYGLMASINELIGFPLQGLNIRYDKLVGFVVANILFVPIILLAIAKLIGLKNKAVNADVGVESNPVVGKISKHLLMLSAALSVAYFGYVALEGSAFASGATYDFYEKVDMNNCDSAFEDKSSYSLKFTFKKETNEIFMTAVYDDKGVRKQEITKLENCSVLDSKNWTCGGVWSGNSKSPRYMFVGGDLAYEKAFYSFVTNCDSKFIRR